MKQKVQSTPHSSSSSPSPFSPFLSLPLKVKFPLLCWLWVQRSYEVMRLLQGRKVGGMPPSPVSLCLARSSMFYGKRDLVYLGQMHFAIFGHREPSLELLKQARALELCRVVSQPTAPRGRGGCDAAQTPLSGARGLCEPPTVTEGVRVWAREQPRSAQSPGLLSVAVR